MKLIEKLYKATMDVKRALELPGVVKQTERVLENKVREYDAQVEDTELAIIRLQQELVEADKDGKGKVFAQIVEQQIELEEAKRIADIAKSVRASLWAEVKE